MNKTIFFADGQNAYAYEVFSENAKTWTFQFKDGIGDVEKAEHLIRRFFETEAEAEAFNVAEKASELIRLTELAKQYGWGEDKVLYFVNNSYSFFEIKNFKKVA